MRRTRRQLDLLDWDPPQPVARFDDSRVRAANLRDRISRGVAETLRDVDWNSRAAIAKDMSAWLGECVTLNMLNAYASQAREAHSIPFVRALALMHVTGDLRLLQLAAEIFGHAVVPSDCLTWVEIGQLAEKRDEIQKQLDAARRQVRSGGRR